MPSRKNISSPAHSPNEISNGARIKALVKRFEGGETSVRRVKELKPVLFAAQEKDERIVYEVRRELYRKQEALRIKALGIRYDITLIFPGPLGRELPKTFGHYHAFSPAGIAYPEIYEVLSGRAWWLIQKPRTANPKIIEEIYLIEAFEREKAIMPPQFGHVSINPEAKRELILANWIGTMFRYDYETFENLRGAGYYLLESKESAQNVKFEKNSYYDEVPEIIKLRPREIPELGITWSTPLYDLIKKPENLEFLTKPEKYLELLTIEKCFRRI